jgi:hypothetical protein
MYSLVSAIGKPLAGGGRWASVAIGDMDMNTLYATYSRVIATLTNPFLAAPVALDLADVRAQIAGQSLTFNQFLTNNGDHTLPTADTLPSLNTRYAKYVDAFRAGYTVQPISKTAAADSPLPAADKTWLHLTRADVDFAYFRQSCLVSVNGYYHFLDADATGAYVRDGMVSRTKSKQANIGIVSFASLGKLTYVDLTADMVYKQNDDERMRDRVYLDLKQDVSDKTVMLVVGGYLMLPQEGHFTQIGDSLFQLDMENIPYLDRFFESRDTIDLSSLPLTQNSHNATQVSVEELLSDEAIKAYLTLSQSFVVLLDNKEVFVERDVVQKGVLSNQYVSYVEPWYPVRLGFGRTAEYWSKYELGQWSLTVQNPWKSHRVFWSTDPYQENSIADSQEPMNRFVQSEAEFLYIGSDLA